MLISRSDFFHVQFPFTDKVSTTSQLFRLAYVVKIFQDIGRKVFPNTRAGFLSHWARDKQVLSVSVSLSRDWIDLSHDNKMLSWWTVERNWASGTALKETTIKQRIHIQNCRVGQLLDCRVWIYDESVKGLSWGKNPGLSRILHLITSRIIPQYSKWFVSSCSDCWRFRI